MAKIVKKPVRKIAPAAVNGAPEATPAQAKAAAAQRVTKKPTAEERRRMIEVAAYYIAERNGFRGDPAAHWAQAEAEIAGVLKG